MTCRLTRSVRRLYSSPYCLLTLTTLLWTMHWPLAPCHAGCRYAIGLYEETGEGVALRWRLGHDALAGWRTHCINEFLPYALEQDVALHTREWGNVTLATAHGGRVDAYARRPPPPAPQARLLRAAAPAVAHRSRCAPATGRRSPVALFVEARATHRAACMCKVLTVVVRLFPLARQ